MELGLLFNLGNDNNKGEFVPPPPAAPVNVAAPVISGNPYPSYVLQCSVGRWSGWPSPSFSYQWKKGGVAISGATSSTYTVVSDDVDAVITCTVTATNTEDSVSATSAGVTVVLLPVVPSVVAMPVISGTPNPGSVLSCTNGTWAGTPAPTLTRQWTRNSVPISGATNSTYTLQAQDDGAIVSCTITATNSSGSANAAAEGVLVFIPATLPSNTAVPVISGTPILGSTLSCSTGSWTGYPTPTYAYQWKRNGTNINGATSSTYTVNANDSEGDALSCAITATNVAGSVSATSASVAVVVPTEAPVNISAPVLSGAPNVGVSLTVSTGTWSGTPTPSFTYQWKKDDVDISGATSSSYTIVSGDMNGVLTCIVTATNSAGSSSATSNSKTVVEVATNPFDALYDESFALTTLSADPTPVQAKPAKSTGVGDVSYTDSLYGTKVFRMTNAVTITPPDPDGADAPGTTMLRHDYSRRQMFNCNNTKMMVIAYDGTMQLYDANTFQWIKQLDGGQSSECIWHATDPNIYFYTANQVGGRIWWTENVVTGEIQEVINFNTLGTYPQAQGFWFKGEGCFSADGRYAGFMATTYDNVLQKNVIHGLVCYDFVAGAVVGTLDAADFPTPDAYPDHCSISASGNWIVPSWGRDEGGTRAYSRDFSTNHLLFNDSTHSDLGVGPNGEDLYVYADYLAGSADEGWVMSMNMDTMETVRLIPLYFQPSSACAVHISMKAFDKPGWAVLSTYQEMSAESGNLIENKVMLAECVENGRRYNIAHTQHRHVDAGYDYFLEPQATASRDLTRIAWASDMNTVPAAREVYMVGLPSWAVPNASVVDPTAPVNTVAPSIQNAPYEGGTVVVNKGTWTGTPTPVYTYQWKRNGTNISGATTSSFAIPTGYAGDTLTCTVTATNTGGSASATTSGVTVTMLAVPVNTVAPAVTGSSVEGSTLTCSSGTWTESPTSYAYQWKKNGVDISGATGTTFLLPMDYQGSSVTCVVTATNVAGSSSATSNAITVVDLTAPVNTAAPVVSGMAYQGGTLTATTGSWTMEPSSYSYQWKKDGTNITGATGSSFQVPFTGYAGAVITCEVTATNAAGSTTQASNSSTISGDSLPILLGAHGVGSSLGVPANQGVATLDTSVTGSGFLVFCVYEANHPETPVCTDNKGNTYAIISNKDDRSYVFWSDGSAGGGAGHVFTITVAPSVYMTMFVAEVKGSSLTVDQFASNLTTADPHTSPSITPTSNGQIIFAFTGGRTTPNAAITVDSGFSLIDTQTESSANPYYTGASAYAYQSTAAPIAATWTQVGNTYALNHIISIGSGSSAGSPSFTTSPQSQSVVDGGTVTMTAAATGSPTPTLQWQSNSGNEWNNVIGATGTSYTTPALTLANNGIKYRVIATNTVGNATSAEATITVTAANTAPTFSVQPQSTTIADGNTVTLSVLANGTPSPTYQWQSDSGSGWSDLSGQTATSYTSGVLTEANTGIQYRCIATNSEGSATSNVATITVTAGSVPIDLEVGAHGVGSFNPTPYPYEQAEVTLNTRSDGKSGFIVYGLMEANHPGSVSASDNMGNTYTLLSASSGAGGENRSYVFFSPGGAGGAGHTFTFHGPAGVVSYPSMYVVEINGEGLSVDKYADTLDTAAPLDTPSITPSSNGQAIIAITGGRTDGAITVSSPFTIVDSWTDSAGGVGGFYTGATAYAKQATAAPISATFTQSGNTYALNHILSIKKA